MSVTPARLSRRYAPLIALAAVQVLLVAVAPSGPPGADTSVVAGTDGFTPGGVTGDGTTSTGDVSDSTDGVVVGTQEFQGQGSSGGATGSSAGSRTASGATPGATGGGVATGQAGTAAGQPAGTGGGTARAGTAAAAADLSRCDPTGRQIGPTYYMPKCQPVWKGGDNGGATMTGVTATEVKYLVYQQQGDETVNAILGTQGLAATQQETCLARQAFNKAINKRWEFYGRKMVPLDGTGPNKGSDSAENECKFPFFLGRCQLSPPDPPCARQEAEIIATQIKPAIVYGGSGNAFYNELAKRGIIVVGGSEYPESYYNDFDGFRYDVFQDGTNSMRMMAEYYCKKLAGKPVRFAGPDVMGVSPPKRKTGLLFPKTYGDPVFELSADVFVKTVAASSCAGGEKINVYPYESDINKAQQQSTTIVSSLKQDNITTVICFCDPIAPVFLTNTMDSQGYHPEQVMTGTGLIDYDVLGRLYNPNVWRYAFGLSHLQVPLPFAKSDATRAWQDAGNTGEPNATANLPWAYFSLIATMVHDAGPNLNPDSIKSARFRAPVRGGWAETNGSPHYPAIKFGPGDFTGIDDAREVWWCNGRISEIDGKPGSYAFADNGHRYNLGEWPGGEPQVNPGVC